MKTLKFNRAMLRSTSMFVTISVITQNKSKGIREIVSKFLWKEREKVLFNDIVKETELFFKSKHPKLSKKQPSTGEYRDSDFIKYQRWKRFWEYRLYSVVVK